MKNLKKLLALVLALALVVTAFAACAEKPAEETKEESTTTETKEETTEEAEEEDGTIHPMRYVQPGNLPTDYETGIAAVNEKLAADGVNIEVSIIRIPWDAYAEKLNLMLTTGEEFELLHVMQDVKNLSNIVGMGALLPVGDMMENYPDLYNKFTEKEWLGTLVDGEEYAVPCYWRSFDNVQGYVTYRADVAKAVGYEEFPETVDGIIDMMKKSQDYILEETGIKAYNWYHQTQDNPHWLYRSFDSYPFYVEKSLGIVLVRQDGTVDSYYESDEFKQASDIYYDMYQAGLVHPDVLSLDHQKKYDEAVKNYEMGINHLKPDTNRLMARFNQNCGIAQIQLGDYHKALSSFETAMRQDPSIKTGYNLVLCHSVLSSMDELKEAFTRLLAVKPNSHISQKWNVVAASCKYLVGIQPACTARMVQAGTAFDRDDKSLRLKYSMHRKYVANLRDGITRCRRIAIGGDNPQAGTRTVTLEVHAFYSRLALLYFRLGISAGNIVSGRIKPARYGMCIGVGRCSCSLADIAPILDEH